MANFRPVKNLDNLEQVWNKIFKSRDPFAWPFSEILKDGLIFYPTEGYALSKEQYNAISKTAKAMGEIGFNFSIVEFNDPIFKDKNILDKNIHWFCEYPSYEEYLGLISFPMENSIYSNKGTWGALISHEMHAIIGGSKIFIDGLKSEYPLWKKEFNNFVQFWSNESDKEWIQEIKLKVNFENFNKI